tara:strand:+ start:5997 stop:10496 length:4500 start_codon:yes stop_codon:yes gene_type:complete
MRIVNAHQNNLKNIDLEIPENQLIVVTGLSGSGKSSLAMGVIANEGYRYFLESLPNFNQQNGQSIPTAEVDEIQDLPPVIKVEQSKRFQSTNTTFGTLSELSSIFRILFARYAAADTLSKSLFSFNHPKGACPICNGIGEAEYIDLDKLVGDENKTLREGAITTTLPNGYIVYSQITVDELNKVAQAHGFSVDIPWKDLSSAQQEVVLNGSERIKVFYGKHTLESRLRWDGIKAKPREEGFYKGMLPIMKDILRRDRNANILKFVSSQTCPSCKGARIKAKHLKYKWQDKNFSAWLDLSLKDLYHALHIPNLSAGEKALVEKIQTQLLDLIRLGMEEYKLSDPSSNISSGDAQRIKLVNQVHCKLQGILYVFDEPSIGLSADYQEHLLGILKRLIEQGNTVMVVEHDLDFIRAADWIVELGPAAGAEGGSLVFNGTISDFLKKKGIQSPTLAALQEVGSETNKGKNKPPIKAAENFEPKAHSLSVISRKTPELMTQVLGFCERKALNFSRISDQPIGKTPRSNPSTYTGLADKIRDLLAKTEQAKALNLGKGAFSFNNKSGRCDACDGAGVITLSMSLLGSINQTCPTCNGQRFKPEVLQVYWHEKNIAEIYNLSITNALAFFSSEREIKQILALMIQLGLGYIKLGQPSNTLSGGEAQRIKLTKHFAKKSTNTLLFLEEPSIGLHHHNVKQLLQALHHLKKQTAGIICIENHRLFQADCDVLVENALLADAYEMQGQSTQNTKWIDIRGARTHHLKDLNLKFPKQKLSVITGLSGSGKSSLVIDTLHGFGLQEMTKQFSAYQQSRVGVNYQLEVDHIYGLSPTICISRKQKNYSYRSDIAKQTGIDKILRFAFSRKAQYLGTELSASHFSDNHDLGKCLVCDGFGQELLPDYNKIVLDENQSIASGLLQHNKALAYYGDPEGQHMAILKSVGKKYGFDLETGFKDLSKTQKAIILAGAEEDEWQAEWVFRTKTRQGRQRVKMKWQGIFHYLRDEYYKTRTNKNVASLKSLFSEQECGECQGSGLKKDRLKIVLNGKSIYDLKSMNFNELKNWLDLKSSADSVDIQLIEKIADYLQNTLFRAKQLHIDHLQLKRKSPTLSGGENQRVEIIRQLNSPLKGITYLLDEPSAGLSNDNTSDLIEILKDLVEKGNTVLVIEHNKEIIHAAQHVVELGPKAGRQGGYISYEGGLKGFLAQAEIHPFLKEATPEPTWQMGGEQITLSKVAKHGLVKDKLAIPVGGITALSGKSGVGKTTLVKDILIPSINQNKPVNCEAIQFSKAYTQAHYFETKKLRTQANTLLVSYLDFLKLITKVFSLETGLKAQTFSYKTKSSQCPTCKGAGYIETSLDIVANAMEECEDCKGNRYNEEVLSYKVYSKNMAEVLRLNISELSEWFNKSDLNKSNLKLIKELEDLGLAHLSLDQKVQSLSSGEKQRLLLLDWLLSGAKAELFVLDEPCTGLHYADIDLLYDLLLKLSKANDILVIEHNPYLLSKINRGLFLD